MTKTALVTGATSGIGKATAIALANEGIDIIICGRRKQALEKLREDLKGKANIHLLSFDVSKKEEVIKAIETLPDEFRDIDILINNAGNAHGLAPIQSGDTDDWDAMIDSNVKGLLYVSRAVIPGMVKRKSGHIINIGSTAGKEVYANGNVYCASKHAVDAINKSMRIDLNESGIRVGAVNPGFVETEFSEVRFKGDKERAKSVYEGFKPLYPEDIADIIRFIVTRPAHVNIGDLLVLPTAQANASLIKKD